MQSCYYYLTRKESAWLDKAFICDYPFYCGITSPCGVSSAQSQGLPTFREGQSVILHGPQFLSYFQLGPWVRVRQALSPLGSQGCEINLICYNFLCLDGLTHPVYIG
jgi:hypothetical protein